MVAFGMHKNYIEKRTHTRIRTNLYARFFLNQEVHKCIVTNISPDGLCIKANDYYPLNAKIHVLIPLIDEVLKIPAEICRLLMTDDLYKGFAVRIIRRPENYLKFFNEMLNEKSF